MDERAAALKKIRKLLLKAADKGSPDAERETARNIAAHMMKKHGIDEVEVWRTTSPEEIEEAVGPEGMDEIYSKISQFVGELEKEQDKFVEKLEQKAAKYIEDNRDSIKKKFGDWLDGLFK